MRTRRKKCVAYRGGDPPREGVPPKEIVPVWLALNIGGIPPFFGRGVPFSGGVPTFFYRCARSIENFSRIRKVVARASGMDLASILKRNTFWKEYGVAEGLDG